MKPFYPPGNLIKAGKLKKIAGITAATGLKDLKFYHSNYNRASDLFPVLLLNYLY